MTLAMRAIFMASWPVVGSSKYHDIRIHGNDRRQRDHLAPGGGQVVRIRFRFVR